MIFCLTTYNIHRWTAQIYNTDLFSWQTNKYGSKPPTNWPTVVRLVVLLSSLVQITAHNELNRTKTSFQKSFSLFRGNLEHSKMSNGLCRKAANFTFQFLRLSQSLLLCSDVWDIMLHYSSHSSHLCLCERHTRRETERRRGGKRGNSSTSLWDMRRVVFMHVEQRFCLAD